MPEYQHDVVDGVPVHWTEGSESFSAGLVFRVGRADETMHQGGITHLVEHLALPVSPDPNVEFNGVVTPTNTHFWATGPKAETLRFITELCERITSLPWERLQRERRILQTETSSWSPSRVEYALSLRFGPAGYGLPGYE